MRWFKGWFYQPDPRTCQPLTPALVVDGAAVVAYLREIGYEAAPRWRR